MVHSGCVVFKIHVPWKKIKHLSKYLGGRQHRTTPACQILGVATLATPVALTPMKNGLTCYECTLKANGSSDRQQMQYQTLVSYPRSSFIQRNMFPGLISLCTTPSRRKYCKAFAAINHKQCQQLKYWNLTSCCSSDGERPHRCCHIVNNFDSRRIFPMLYNGPEDVTPKLPFPPGYPAPT